jgi:hypothetical protein
MIVAARSFERAQSLHAELKEDSFSALAKKTFAKLLAEVGSADLHSAGISFANAYGGWTFGQKELEELADRGPRHVSAFQATAWFPAAAQGQITIDFGLKIPARTFSTEGLCFYHALQHARRMLNTGTCRSMFVGSAECFGSPWLRNAFHLMHAEDCATWFFVRADGDHSAGDQIRLRYVVDPLPEDVLAADLAQPEGSSCTLPFAVERTFAGSDPIEVAGLSVLPSEGGVTISPRTRMAQ